MKLRLFTIALLGLAVATTVTLTGCRSQQAAEEAAPPAETTMEAPAPAAESTTEAAPAPAAESTTEAAPAPAAGEAHGEAHEEAH